MSIVLRADSPYVLQTTPPTLSMRCPTCGQIGTFEGIGQNDIQLSGPDGPRLVGHRRCPNSECHTHIFVVCDQTEAILAAYPPEVIDFDATNVPSNVVSALAEAVRCHANSCYVAAAIMVRKTLEELCADRGATGANLKDRIAALGTKVFFPKSSSKD
jgi:Domain of unknown function (DUF4145)